MKENPSSEKAEHFIKGLTTLRVNKSNVPFAYNYNKLKQIWGRQSQMKQLTAFADEEAIRFQFCVVTGPAGIGKSRLVFHLGRQYHLDKKWLVRNIGQQEISELYKKKDWFADKKIMLIIDYANEQSNLKLLLSKLRKLSENGECYIVRVILIAREGCGSSLFSSDEAEFPQWYTDLIQDDKSIHDYLYQKEFIELGGLNAEECSALHNEFVANHLKRNNSVRDELNVRSLIEREVMDEDGLARPLYVLFVIDSYYKSPDGCAWDLASLQNQIYERDWDKWETEICGKRKNNENRRTLFLALTNLLIYSTIFGCWESGITLPEPLTNDCRTVFRVAREYTKDPKARLFKLLTGKCGIVNDEPALMRLTPDMIGEFYVLMRFATFDNELLQSWATLLSSQLSKCKDFFVRAIQDYGNHKFFINVFLKLFRLISQCLDQNDKDARMTFAFLLETLVRNYKGNEDDQIALKIIDMVKGYIKDKGDKCVYAAELNLIFYENRPHIGNTKRIACFKIVESLYNKWEKSTKLAVAYIDFLGNIVASRIGAHEPGHSDYYVERFDNLYMLASSSKIEIKRAFLPVLIKMILRAISINDWNRYYLLQNDFLIKVIDNCDEDLLIDFISEYSSVIISLAEVMDKLHVLESRGDDAIRNKQMREIGNCLEAAIILFENVIDAHSVESLNFTWSYINKLPMITKNLYVHNCSPYNEMVFRYMKDKFEYVHTDYTAREDCALIWYIPRVLEHFCNTKAESIPLPVKIQCDLLIQSFIKRI